MLRVALGERPNALRGLNIYDGPGVEGHENATFESIDAAERALIDAQDVHRARLKAAEDAIESAKEEARKAYAVDDEAMSAARRTLHWQQRNSLIPVARLPPEIIRAIFAFCSDIDRPWIEEGLSDYPGWLAVTHVCRRWRDVALEYPGLWADVLYSLGPAWADAFVERAQTMPLVVHLDSPYAPDWHIQSVAKNISRTAYLNVEVDVLENY
ncbi:hypothetical protein FA95DRAFT_1611006 [Auriscalpium vulgare]|uniref:Uncharacterized protein n=1 Tax=Auriscalpium vulgare TaxID=40419 RepID=A0ACB8RBL7_9AGAM|nr:hypothetical protein FA95DRAFT_1611006 [Auriscalpium vulgare]